MKRIIRAEAPSLIFGCFMIALSYILAYELLLTKWPSYSETTFKLGLIASKIAYSILAASIFYFISQYFPIYLPKQEKKLKILFNVYQKAIIADSIISGLKLRLTIRQNEFLEISEFKKLLKTINPDSPVAQFDNWFKYLYDLKTRLLDIIRSITVYNDYLSKEFLQELDIIETQLLTSNTFEGYKTLVSPDLSYAEINLQELLVHNKHLQELMGKEFKKYERKFKIDGAKYREKHYKILAGK